MPRREPQQQGLLPSIVDRLIDPDSEGTRWRHGYDLNEIIDSIRRDLEELLNAHPPYNDIPVEWQELRNSLMAFGLPDLMSVTIATPTHREQLGRMVEEVVARFEPRLRNIHAVLVDSSGNQDRNVRFHIEAEINVDPAPSVTFETILELTTGQAKIETAK